MKKLLAAGLCLTMCVWAAPLGVAAAARDLDIEHGLASQLKELGLFLGVGEKENGTTDFALERAPNRTEALTMLVRALGKEAPAQESAKTHPFSDVPAGAGCRIPLPVSKARPRRSLRCLPRYSQGPAA